MRLIDADALMAAVEGNPLTTDSLKEYVRCVVREQPTIDAVPTQYNEWILARERTPEDNEEEYLITVLDRDDGVSEVYKGFYTDGEWWTQWCHGCKKISDESCGDNVVVAWMELPKPYKCEWIDVVNSHCTCSVCGSEWSYFENETERFNYCPNCGARMDEE